MTQIGFFILWNGGGLRLASRMRALPKDELALQNRGRTLVAGFHTAIGAALFLYAINGSILVDTGDALKVVSGAGVAAALLRYAWLEWHWR